MGTETYAGASKKNHADGHHHLIKAPPFFTCILVDEDGEHVPVKSPRLRHMTEWLK